mgnify:CR=1 FL=1
MRAVIACCTTISGAYCSPAGSKERADDRLLSGAMPACKKCAGCCRAWPFYNDGGEQEDVDAVRARLLRECLVKKVRLFKEMIQDITWEHALGFLSPDEGPAPAPPAPSTSMVLSRLALDQLTADDNDAISLCGEDILAEDDQAWYNNSIEYLAIEQHTDTLGELYDDWFVVQLGEPAAYFRSTRDHSDNNQNDNANYNNTGTAANVSSPSPYPDPPRTNFSEEYLITLTGLIGEELGPIVEETFMSPYFFWWRPSTAVMSGAAASRAYLSGDLGSNCNNSLLFFPLPPYFRDMQAVLFRRLQAGAASGAGAAAC